ncbi:MAG: hypothetical protein HOV67_36960 [Kribbellaceae bacterium]|nr:hypothetical protein [Kribbellaceae bacterium]
MSAPTLILAGGPRSHLDQSRFALLAGSMPDAAIRTIDAGHRIHSTEPARWLAEVKPFLAFKGA